MKDSKDISKKTIMNISDQSYHACDKSHIWKTNTGTYAIVYFFLIHKIKSLSKKYFERNDVEESFDTV